MATNTKDKCEKNMMSRMILIVAMNAAFFSSTSFVAAERRGAVAACSTCYQTIRNSTRAAAGGRDVAGMSVKVDAPLPPSAADASIVTNDIRVAFKEWRVPTSGSHPHDPLATRDGAIWYTGQMANLLGRLDPKTGQFREYRLKTENSGPHGLVSDANGAIWFTERPRRIAATSDDLIWYSDYARGYLGRLNPNTGKVIEWPSPGGRDSGPYAITAVDDVIWYAESARTPNMLVRFDPKTETFRSWPIPSGGGVIRNMTPTPSGGLALACSGVDMVALVEIAKGTTAGTD